MTENRNKRGADVTVSAGVLDPTLSAYQRIIFHPEKLPQQVHLKHQRLFAHPYRALRVSHRDGRTAPQHGLVKHQDVSTTFTENVPEERSENIYEQSRKFENSGARNPTEKD
eukprot:8138707-Pyramimonas_sp.AAC.1